MHTQKLKYEIKQLQRVLHPERTELHLIFAWSRDDEPHGCFGGGRRVYIKEGSKVIESYYEPLSYTEEMQQFSRTEYDDLINKNPFMREPEHPFSTYEKWVEYHRCKCGKHGEKGDKPYLGLEKP